VSKNITAGKSDIRQTV